HAPSTPGPFVNEPLTDPALPANRERAQRVVSTPPTPPSEPITTDVDAIDARVALAVAAQPALADMSPADRRALPHRAAAALCAPPAPPAPARVHEGHKTIAEADPEIAEAIDCARWYGDQIPDLHDVHGAAFSPLGVVLVVPPWNFPAAIPCGGVTAALAAGNAVIFKPAPETPR